MEHIRTGAAVTAERRATTRRLIYWAAGLSIGALIAHGIDFPDHLTEWWGYSAFFVTAGSFQFFYGFGLFLQPWRYGDGGKERENGEAYGRPYYVLGLVLAACVVLLYVITRTTGMPFLGPAAGPERFTVLSLVPVVEDLPILYCLTQVLVITHSWPTGETSR